MNQDTINFSGADLLKAIYDGNTEFLDEVLQNTDSKILARIRRAMKKHLLLHYAVVYSTPRIVKHFLNIGLSSDDTKNLNQTQSQTPLHLAVIHCKYRMVKLLLDYGYQINAADQSSRSALHHAVENSIRRELCTSSRAIVCHLLRRGAAVNVKTYHGETPLLYAIKHGSETLVRLFLRRGVDLNQRNSVSGDNALHYAVRKNHKNIVKMLLNAGAEVDSLAKKGRTALHLAATKTKNDEIVDLLIKRGALVNAEDDRGRTPLCMPNDDDDEDDEDDDEYYTEDDNDDDDTEDEEDIAKRQIHIVRSLLDAGAKVNHNISKTGETAFHRAISSGIEPIMELFLERGADVHAQTANGRSSLHLAMKYASEKFAGKLIDKGANIAGRSAIGSTPLHLAVQFHRETHIKLLLNRGADINAIDNRGYTPLHYVARSAHLDELTIQTILDILLLKGADPYKKSTDGKNSLEYAIEKSNTVMIKALLCHLADLEAIGDDKATKAAMSAIGKDEHWLRVYANRQREIVIMKTEMIYENISYFDVTTRDSDILVRNKEFVKAFKNNQVIKKFDFYDMVEKVIEIALNKQYMTETTVECLCVLLSDFKVPIPAVEIIVKNLRYEDLERFVQYWEKCEK